MNEEQLYAEFNRVNGHLAALQFLIEQFLSNAFLQIPEEFEAFMDAALEQTRRASTRAGPMTDEAAQEQIVEVATRLERIRQRVAERLRSA
jgi:hypothetical protein